MYLTGSHKGNPSKKNCSAYRSPDSVVLAADRLHVEHESKVLYERMQWFKYCIKLQE